MNSMTLYNIIMSENTESGMYSRAYYVFCDCIRVNLDEAKKSLVSLVENNLDNEHLLEGILDLLSDLDFEVFLKEGNRILDLCYTSESVCVLDKVISVCESWETNKAIEILNKISTQVIWLNDYRLAVREDIDD